MQLRQNDFAEARYGRPVHVGSHARFLRVDTAADRTVRLVVPDTLEILPFHLRFPTRYPWRHSMDALYLVGLSVLFALTAGLAVGCARLGGMP